VRDVAKLRALLRSRPDDIRLLNETAWALPTMPIASIRDGAEAVELAQRAVRLGHLGGGLCRGKTIF
jgi:hypothetical protein